MPGIYKSDVKRAFDSLVAKGINPSIDALRVELGNTGSKSTIHKFLKELNLSGSEVPSSPSVSEAIQNLIEGLAFQLHSEADERIVTISEKFKLQEVQFRSEISELTSKIKDMNQMISNSLKNEASLSEELRLTKDRLNNETVLKHSGEQRIAGLLLQNKELEIQRESLTQTAQHDRDALAHFQEAARSQRDQDLRRHDHIVQELRSELQVGRQSFDVKQNEVIRLNQEGAKLSAELNLMTKRVYELEMREVALLKEKDELTNQVRRIHELEFELKEKVIQQENVEHKISKQTTEIDSLKRGNSEMHQKITTLEALLDAEKSRFHEIKTILNTSQVNNPNN